MVCLRREFNGTLKTKAFSLTNTTNSVLVQTAETIVLFCIICTILSDSASYWERETRVDMSGQGSSELRRAHLLMSWFSWHICKFCRTADFTRKSPMFFSTWSDWATRWSFGWEVPQVNLKIMEISEVRMTSFFVHGMVSTSIASHWAAFHRPVPHRPAQSCIRQACSQRGLSWLLEEAKKPLRCLSHCSQCMLLLLFFFFNMEERLLVNLCIVFSACPVRLQNIQLALCVAAAGQLTAGGRKFEFQMDMENKHGQSDVNGVCSCFVSAPAATEV